MGNKCAMCDNELSGKQRVCCCQICAGDLAAARAENRRWFKKSPKQLQTAWKWLNSIPTDIDHEHENTKARC